MPSIVSGLPARPMRDDAPAGDPEAACRDAEHRVGDEPADDRQLDAAPLGTHAETVAHRVAEARQDPVRPTDVIGLGHEPEVGVGELDRRLRHRGSHARARARAPPGARPARRAARRRDRHGRGSRAPRRTARGRLRAATPGRKKTLAPGAIASRMPQAAARSKRSARLTSKKWKCDVTPTGTAPSLTTVSPCSRARHSSAVSATGGGPVAADRVVQDQQPAAVGEQRLDLDAADELGDALERRRRDRAAGSRQPRPRHRSARRGPPRRPRRRSAPPPRPGRAAGRARAACAPARRRGTAAGGPARAGGGASAAAVSSRGESWRVAARARAVALPPWRPWSASRSARSRPSCSPPASCGRRFVPGAGMIGCSLHHRGDELLVQRGGLDAWRGTGKSFGLPLLHPWANRLRDWRYAAAGRAVDDRPLDRGDRPRRRARPADPRRAGRRGGLGGRSTAAPTPTPRG